MLQVWQSSFPPAFSEQALQFLGLPKSCPLQLAQLGVWDLGKLSSKVDNSQLQTL